MIYINARFLTQPITGVQRYGIEISLQLKKLLSNEVVCVSPRNVMHHEIAEKLDVRIVGKHTGHIWEQFDLPTYLKENEYPILLNLANTAPICYKNKISTLHDTAFLAYPETYSKAFLWFYRFVIPKILHSSKHILTVSQFSKKEIIKYYGILDEKVSVVYNAVNKDFRPYKEDRLLREKFFLAVSSLNYRKNFLLILKAFEKIKVIYPEYKLLVIGDLVNNSFDTIDIRKYQSDTHIQFLGRVNDMDLIKYYSNSFAFIYPSLYEGFGIPPLEAQACGTSVIVSNASSLPEVFGESALYCDPMSVDSLVQQMDYLIRNQKERDSLIERGFANVERFSWSESAKKILSIIKK